MLAASCGAGVHRGNNAGLSGEATSPSQRRPDVRSGGRHRALSRVRSALSKAHHPSRKKCGDSEILMTDMTVAYQIFRETHRSRVTLDRANGRILVEWSMVRCADSELFGSFNRETTTAATWGSTYPTSSQARCWRCCWVASSTPHSVGSCKRSRVVQTPFMAAASGHRLGKAQELRCKKNCQCPLIPVASFTTQCTWNFNELQVDLILFRRAETQPINQPGEQRVNPAVSHQPRYGNDYSGAAFERLLSALSVSSSEAFGQYSRQSSRSRQAELLVSRAKSCRQRSRLSHNMQCL